MRRESVVEVGGVGVRFIEDGEGLRVCVQDVLEAAGFANASATWSRARERSEEANLEAREVRYGTRLPGRKAKIVTLPLSNMADLLTEINATTHGHGGVSREERRQAVHRMRGWLMEVRPFSDAPLPDASPYPTLFSPPLAEEVQKIGATLEPALLEVLPAVEPAPLPQGGGDTPEEILAVLFEGRRLRLTPEKPARVSLLDVLAAVGYASPQSAWRDLKEQHPEVVREAHDFQFPGQGQRPTPVATKRTLLKIMNLAAGPKLAPFKEWSARTLERYLDGDPELAAEVLDRAERKANLPPTPEALTMAQRLERARYLKEAADALAEFIPAKSVASLRLLAAEEATGQRLTHMKPAIEGGCVHTPEEVERRNGVPRSVFGRVAGELGLKGSNGEGLEGYSEPYQNTANGGSRTVVCYRYSRAAVEQVLAEIDRRKGEHN